MKKLILNKHLMVALGAVLMTTPLMAQTTPAPEKNWYVHDGLFWLLIAVAVILLYVIYALAEVVIWGAKKKISDRGNTTKILALVGTAVMLMSGNSLMAQAASAPAAAPASGLLQSGYLPLYILIAIEVLAIAYMSIMLLQLSKKEQLEATGKAETWLSQLWEKWNYKVPIEREDEMLISDHDYDGIHELDNGMPPWLQYMFFFTIGFAIVYLWYYNIGNGPTQIDEYNASVEKAEIEKAAYLAAAGANYDENTVILSTDAAVLANGKSTFQQYCVPCHGANAEGTTTAPNLTDDYWIHGGKINDLFKTVKYGVQGKAMASWQEVLDPKQIFEVTNYIKSLHGSNPANAKAPEGALYVEGGEAAPADTSAVTPDSLTVQNPATTVVQ